MRRRTHPPTWLVCAMRNGRTAQCGNVLGSLAIALHKCAAGFERVHAFTEAHSASSFKGRPPPMSKSRPVHVVPSEGKWAVRPEGAPRPVSHHATKSAAEAAGRTLAKREETELVIHGRDGRIQDRDSFGSDPFPPRDTKH